MLFIAAITVGDNALQASFHGGFIDAVKHQTKPHRSSHRAEFGTDLCLCRSASPALRMRGLNRTLGSSKTQGGRVESGLSTASFETAREDALTRLSSGQDKQLQPDLQGRSVTSDSTLGQASRVL